MSESNDMQVDQQLTQQQQQPQQIIQQPQPQYSNLQPQPQPQQQQQPQPQQQPQHHHHHHHHGHHHHKDQNANTANYIGKYQVLKTLGEGSFGKVKLAQHTVTGQKVALKIINRKTLAKSDMQGRIEREISYLRLLRHPHIIKLYDVIKSKDDIIMVIEYAGKELFDYIVQRGKMPEDEARRFSNKLLLLLNIVIDTRLSIEI